MDLRNYKFWRKNLSGMDKTTAEFDVLFQRTINTITIGERIRGCFQVLQGTSSDTKIFSRWGFINRNIGNIRKNIQFFKKL